MGGCDRMPLMLIPGSHHYTKADGTTVEWHQENESAVRNKQEAVDMVQRTIDFWVPRLASDLVKMKGLSPDDAKVSAKKVFAGTLQMHLLEPFAVRWDLKLSDFTWPD